MSDYDKCTKGALKLKIGVDMKKKKKNKEKKKKILEQIPQTSAEAKQIPEKSEIKLTKAEIAFNKQKEEVLKKRILEQASMTHKQKVEVFNRHLDSLTEHFDIPKVSWTK
ncbi:protein FAM32A [Planococcus citri]|uniref:protein FAM32A n=1 Tax=Planococcus citri TaxID=170843 RepID=UPI0031F88285